MALAAVLVWGVTVQSVLLILAAPFILALLVIDIRHYLLPDRLVFILGVIGVLWRLAGRPDDLPYGILAIRVALDAVLYAVPVYLMGRGVSFFLKRDSLGFGDVKFFAVAGIWLGFAFLPLYLMAAGALGVIFGLVWRGLTGGKVFPFGPALIMALWAGLCVLPTAFFHHLLHSF